MKLSENTVREIADWLQCGLECWIHKLKGTMYFLPNLDDPYFDPSQWEEVLTSVQGHEEEYLVFQTMDSSHSYRIMQDFASSLTDSPIRADLEYALSGPRPFHNFNSRLAHSVLREKWADFRFNAHMDWVKSQVNCYDLVC
ncbi:UPF0158 family protein [Cryomorphaceae bacterium 1068]|nr:UPF0158 family protein [Cryomorphaceae bacterium 1068]